MDRAPAVATPLPAAPVLTLPLMATVPAPPVVDPEAVLGAVFSPPQPAQNSSPYAAKRRRMDCLCSLDRFSRSCMRIAFQKWTLQLERDPGEDSFACGALAVPEQQSDNHLSLVPGVQQ